VAEGGKRAGKNVLNVIAFAMAIERSVEKIHLVAGVTRACARLNIVDCNGFGLRNFFGGRCWEGKYEGKEAIFVDDKVVIIEGGGKASDAARIKGASFGCVYLSEANELNKGFFFEAIDRTLAARTRRVFLDLNAKEKGHWFYREFLDRFDVQGDKSVNYGHFTVFDNKALNQDDLRARLASYDKASAWYRRDILGLRCGGADVIYSGFDEGLIVPRDELSQKKFVRMAVGVDVGGRDATVATLVGITADGELALVDGYYHRQGKRNEMTHAKYVEELADCIAVWMKDFAAFEFGGAVFCESAEKMFRAALAQELARRGIRTAVYPSYKKDGILDRIRLFSFLINKKKLLVAKELSAWVDAFYAARWCEKAREKGEWVRVDDGSYSVDCLDSAEYGVVPFKQLIMKMEV